VLAQLQHTDAVGLVAGDQRSRRLREQHLAAVTGRANPGSTCDVEAEVSLVAG
jgi:hypothetical protein